MYHHFVISIVVIIITFTATSRIYFFLIKLSQWICLFCPLAMVLIQSPSICQTSSCCPSTTILFLPKWSQFASFKSTFLSLLFSPYKNHPKDDRIGLIGSFCSDKQSILISRCFRTLPILGAEVLSMLHIAMVWISNLREISAPDSPRTHKFLYKKSQTLSSRLIALPVFLEDN